MIFIMASVIIFAFSVVLTAAPGIGSLSTISETTH